MNDSSSLSIQANLKFSYIVIGESYFNLKFIVQLGNMSVLRVEYVGTEAESWHIRKLYPQVLVSYFKKDGQVGKWSKRADCKSVGCRLRGFESLPAHKEIPKGVSGIRKVLGSSACAGYLSGNGVKMDEHSW